MARKNKENKQLIMDGVAPEKGQSFAKQNLDEQDSKQVVLDGQICFFGDQSDAIIDQEVARERLNQAIETQKPKKKKKSIIMNVIFLAINVFVLFFIINSFLGKTEDVSLLEILTNQGERLWWLALAAGLLIVYYFADSMMIYFLIRSSTGQKRFFTAFKVSATGKYFEAITPFNVGGQPSQILSLTKSGFSSGIATSIPIIKVIIYNILYTLTIILFFIFGVPLIPTANPLTEFLTILIKIFAYLGLFITALISLIIILIGTGRIVGRSLVRGIVKVGYKLHIVKDYRKTYNKIMNQVLEYQSSIQYLRKNKKTLIACILFGLLECLSFFSISFAIVMAFSNITFATSGEAFFLLVICISQALLCQMAGIVIPLPGGTGMMEIAFIILFGVSTFVGSTNIVLALLVWRFLTYYYTIIQGFSISTIESIVRMVRAKKETGKIKKQNN